MKGKIFLHIGSLPPPLPLSLLPQVYSVDVESGDQSSWGYLGAGDGQLQHPTGILADDRSLGPLSH